MSGSTSLGRLPAAQVGQPVIYDAPERTIAAILTQQDAIIAALQALAAQLDTNSVTGHPYNTGTLVAALAPIQLEV